MTSDGSRLALINNLRWLVKGLVNNSDKTSVNGPVDLRSRKIKLKHGVPGQLVTAANALNASAYEVSRPCYPSRSFYLAAALNRTRPEVKSSVNTEPTLASPALLRQPSTLAR